MSTFLKLLQEVINDPQFTSVEDFIKSVRSILRKSSIPRIIEKKSKEKGFATHDRFGYRITILNGDITLGFFGVDKSEISGLARDFSKAKIQYHYNEKQEMFMLKWSDNVVPEETLSMEATDELNHNTYNVIGSEAESKTAIKDVINSFDEQQMKVYRELVEVPLLKWTLTMKKSGTSQKYVYILTKIEGDN